MADTSKRQVHVIMLTLSNYTRWRMEVETALRGKGLWWHASGLEVRVQDPGPVPAGADDAAAADHAAKVKTFREWDEKDSQARSLVLTTLDDETFSHVQDCDSSKTVLMRIKELSDRQTTDVLMSSITSFFAERWDETDDATSFMARLATHAHNVNACKANGVKIADQFMTAKTLTSLPAAYGNFASSWNMMAEKDSKLEDFRQKLLAAERRIKSVDSSTVTPDTDDAFHVKSTHRIKTTKNRTKTGTCNYCKKPGH